VAHRFVDGTGRRDISRQEAVESGVGELAPLFERLGEHET